jgi:hypothetical protein
VLKVSDVTKAPLSELVAFYNEKTGRKIKKFPNRKTAVQRVSALMEPAPKKPARTLSDAVKESWTDPDVAAARRLRHGVSVAGTKYRSVRKAFQELNLPESKHIPFRLRLKEKGRATFQSADGTAHTFVLLKDKNE